MLPDQLLGTPGLPRYVELELGGADADSAISGLRAHLEDVQPAARSTRACAPSSAALRSTDLDMRVAA